MVLNRYQHINNYRVVEQPKVPEVNTEILPAELKDNSIYIPTADYLRDTKAYVSVHRLSDYRRKSSSILLVPKVEVLIEKLLFSRDEVLKCTPTL